MILAALNRARKLRWQRVFNFRPEPKAIDARWTTVQTNGIITIPIDILQASICTPAGNQRRRLQDTPHFPYIESAIKGTERSHHRVNYRNYVESFFPDTDINAILEGVEDLASSWAGREGDGSRFTVVIYPPKRKYGFCPYRAKIFDGVHRACIAKILGHKVIDGRVKSR